FEKLVEELEVPRSLSHGPLVQVMLVLQNAPGGALELPGLTLSPVDLPVSTAEVGGALTYSTDLFDATTIARFASHLEQLLRTAAASPELPLLEQVLLGEAERQQITVEWNDSALGLPDVAAGL